MSNSKLHPKLLLVDGHSLAFRSFYALTKGSEGGLTTKDGLPTSVTSVPSVMPLRELAYLPQGIMDPHELSPETKRAGKLPNEMFDLMKAKESKKNQNNKVKISSDVSSNSEEGN